MKTLITLLITLIISSTAYAKLDDRTDALATAYDTARIPDRCFEIIRVDITIDHLFEAIMNSTGSTEQEFNEFRKRKDLKVIVGPAYSRTQHLSCTDRILWVISNLNEAKKGKP